MGHAEVNGADAELGGASSDRTHDLERWLAMIVGDHLRVQPRQAIRRAKRLGQGFLRGKSSRFGRHGTLRLRGSEDPRHQARPTLDRLSKTIDVADVDANTDDHGCWSADCAE